MKLQQTVGGQMEISGKALHSGVMVTMRILPRPADTGIYFGRSDLPGRPQIKAEPGVVIDTKKKRGIPRLSTSRLYLIHWLAIF